MRELTLALALLAMLAPVSIMASSPDFIVRSGKARCVIVLPDNATQAETYAARELQSHVKQMSGVELPQTTEGQRSEHPGPFISIGRTKVSAKHVTAAQLAALDEDGYRVFTSDGNLFFVGGSKHGAMYGVYEFLESLGVRWYSPDYTVIPKRSTIQMPVKPFSFTPWFSYRDEWWNNGWTNEWLARMRVNGSNGEDHWLPASMGGSTVTIHGCHSHEAILPSGQYFDKRPEWYALKEDGSRGRNEWCLTNQELRDVVAAKVIDDIRAKNGLVDVYWVSQNDGGSLGCFSERCTQERLAHGGKDIWAANTIAFTNYVAEKVRREFPNVRIKTLAYDYTQSPPTDMPAADNVLVEICGNFDRPTGGHAELANSWSKTAKNVSVYTYGGSNYGYWWPYPNLWELGMQCVWARKCGIKSFYVQGTALGKGAGMVDLRAYLSARMAWDPSRDVKKEIREFCNGFYGPAGKYLLEYVEWYYNYTEQHKFVVNGGWGNDDGWREWVTKEAMEHSDALFQKAIEAVKNDPAYLNHVRRAYLEVLWGGIMINLAPNSSLMDKEFRILPGVDADSIGRKAKLFGEIMKENGYNKWSEPIEYDPAKYPH